MATVRDGSDVLALLLEGGQSVVAGRLAGAFRNGGQDRMADQILRTMKAAGYPVRQTDPFDSKPQPLLPLRQESPYVNRIRLMWDAMRQAVVDALPKPPGTPNDIEQYLRAVEEVYITDAYHSLSIEGYRVSPALIERVRSGTWHPDGNPEDRDQRDALAARGYYEAFVAVKEGVGKVLRGANPGAVAHDDHSEWYRRLFGPSVMAGILSAADLAGYRTGPVYIRRSMHVPPPREAVRDCMPALFDLLKGESEPDVRVVLGHFVFVYVHPYMDGNGRMGRFLMNVMLASGGYPWTVIPVDRRNDYLRALESASAKQDIEPFAGFVAGLVQDRLAGKPTPEVPATRSS